MKPKLLRTLDFVNEQMTASLLFEAAAAVLGALFGLTVVALLVLGGATAVAILCDLSIKDFGLAVSAFILGGTVGAMLVYTMGDRSVSQRQKGAAH